MASFIISRPMPDRFEVHLREAIEALGYYRPNALEQLLTMYRVRWPSGLSSTMFGVADIEPLLSETGLGIPYDAQKATFLRATFNLRREEFDHEEPQWSSFCSHVTFAARAQGHCDRALDLDRTTLPRQKRFALPLTGCGQRWCPCRWDWAPDQA